MASNNIPSRLEEVFLREILTDDEFYLAKNSAFLLNISLLEAGLVLYKGSSTLLYKTLAKVSGAHYSEIPPQDYSLELSRHHWQPALKTLVLQLSKGKKTAYWHAPQGKLIGEFLRLCEAKPISAKKFFITTPQGFLQFFQDKTKIESASQAVMSLKDEKPHYSASSFVKMRQFSFRLFAVSLTFLSLLFLDDYIAFHLSTFFNALVFMWLFVRLWGTFTTVKPAIITDINEYPVYSIIIALYNESNMMEQLVRALSEIDYPKDKLDIIFMLEEDDNTTKIALESLQSDLPFSIIIAPNLQPRTKPKALMVALPYVRGDYVCVYDAEDIPHFSQLKEALSTFNAGVKELAVLQAPLTIRNERKNALTALFSLDYASLFHATLPFLARYNLPLPLGGTSNHFRASHLREAGGWDPYNVTEDADLGLRLARLGLKAGTLNAATSEEAPIIFDVWLKQRTRWYKGWLQTIAVHYSSPLTLYRDLGALKMSFFSVMIGATFLSSLFHPFVLSLIIYGLIYEQAGFISLYCLTLLLAGYGICLVIYAREIWRKQAFYLALFLPFLPIYWVILSLAAWRALFELYTKPYHWHKTPHGL